MKLKLNLSIIIFLILSGINFLQCGGGTETKESYVGGGTETIGKLVDPQGKAANGATVELFFADSLNSYRATTTDANGIFKFDTIPSGTYTLVCKSSDGKMAFIAFDYDSSKGLILDPATVFPPGSIDGCIKYPVIENQPDHDILVFIPGTSYNAIADDNGRFAITNIPKGTYTLKISKINYSVKKISNVIVTPNNVTVIDSCVSLEIDTLGKPFAPKIKGIVHNELQGTVTLTWNNLPITDLEGYFVYRGTLDDRSKISTVIKDTVFTDTVYKNILTDTVPYMLSYFIKSVDKSNESDYSDPLNITVYPPVLYRCKFTPSIKNANGNDTVTNADTAVLSVKFVNRKRSPQKFIWSIDKDEVCHSITAAFTDSAYRGMDTLRYRWKTPGEKKVFIKSIDDKGDTLSDSFNFVIFDSVELHPTGKWMTFESKMSTKRRFACAAELDSNIYYIGGQIFNSIKEYYISTNSVEKFDIRTGKWSTCAPLPEKVSLASAVTLNGKIYVLGGENESGILSSVYVYDPISGWVKSGNLPYVLSGMSSCTYGNSILIVGGYTEDLSISNAILTYNPSTKKTDTVNVIDNEYRVHHQSVILNDNLYIISGTDLFSENHSTILVYDLKTNMVCKSIPLSHSRCSFSAWINKDRLYIAGGLNLPTPTKASIYKDFEYLDLSVSNMEWVSLEELPQPTYSGASVSVNNGLFLIGGATGNNDGQEINTLNVYYP